MRMLDPIQILIVHDIGSHNQYMAQCNSYPVINGRGDTIDEAVEALLLAILVHLKGRRTRTIQGYRVESY